MSNKIVLCDIVTENQSIKGYTEKNKRCGGEILYPGL